MVQMKSKKVVSVLLAAMLLVGCGGSADSGEKKTTKKDNSPSIQVGSEVTTKAGDSWTFDTPFVTNSFEISINNRIGAQSNNVQVIIPVKYKNAADTTVNVKTALSARVKYKDKYDYKEFDVVPKADDIMLDVAPLTEMEGYVYFTVPSEVGKNLKDAQIFVSLNGEKEQTIKSDITDAIEYLNKFYTLQAAFLRNFPKVTSILALYGNDSAEWATYVKDNNQAKTDLENMNAPDQFKSNQDAFLKFVSAYCAVLEDYSVNDLYSDEAKGRMEEEKRLTTEAVAAMPYLDNPAFQNAY